MKILIVDNNIDPPWGSADLRRMAQLAPGALVHTRRGPQNDLPRDIEDYERIIVSGSKTSALEDSPWIDSLHSLIRRAVDRGIPYLGVCYGHQSLVRALGGKELVGKSAVPEYGWTKIDVLESSALFKGLPRSFFSYSSHQDEVCGLPKGFKCIAKSDSCEIQACELAGKPVFGIQFHPEKDLAGAKKSLAQRRASGMGRGLLRPEESEKLYDARVGEMIFTNFLKSGDK